MSFLMIGPHIHTIHTRCNPPRKLLDKDTINSPDHLVSELQKARGTKSGLQASKVFARERFHDIESSILASEVVVKIRS